LFEPTAFTDILFHPDESQYLTCSANFKIGYWDAFDGSGIRMIDGGESDMTCLDIQSDGNLFVSGSADRSVRVWNYDDGLTIAMGKVHSGTVNSVAISPDQKQVVSVGSEGGIFIWDMSKVCTK
jgi:WD40 repeat protein